MLCFVFLRVVIFVKLIMLCLVLLYVVFFEKLINLLMEDMFKMWLNFCFFIIGNVCLVVIKGVISIIFVKSLNFLVGNFLSGEINCMLVLLINILRWLYVLIV